MKAQVHIVVSLVCGLLRYFSVEEDSEQNGRRGGDLGKKQREGCRGSFKAGGTDGIEKRDRNRLEYKKGIETRRRK